jgi:anthranilate phosphoribosyltransferase
MTLRHLMRVLGPGRKGGRNLTFEESYEAFDAILSGTESEIQIGAFLVLMRLKGVTVEELTGFARAARARATIPCPDMPGLVSVCPPHDGMDRVPPLEVAAGLIAAGAGARVLILSDRCVPPKRGLTAASALDGLGVGMTWDPHEVEEWVAKTRFGACAVTGMLPSLMSLRRVRGDVSIRTPLATVEKLLAPTSSAVVLGAQGGPVLGSAVEVIQGLGHPRGLALQGPEGGVIPSLRKRTRGIELCDRHLVPLNVEPEDFGLACASEPDMPMYGPPPEDQGTGDNPELVKCAGETTRAVLAGENGPARNASVLGAALILKASGRALTLAEGVDAAIESLDSGAAGEVLARLREMSR